MPPKNLHLGFFCNNSLTPFLAAAQNRAKAWLAISLPGGTSSHKRKAVF
jgi:hypothetical protein